jgi:hypothetical protein
MGATQQVSCDVLVRGVRPTGINWKRLGAKTFLKEHLSNQTKQNKIHS